MKSFADLEKAFENGLTAWQEKIFEGEAKRIGLKAVGEVKKLTPVDTGTLRRRWMASIDRSGETVIIWIRNNTIYGPAVNYGSRIVRGGKTVGKTKGKYMLENGVYNYKRKLLQGDIRAMMERLRKEF